MYEFASCDKNPLDTTFTIVANINHLPASWQKDFASLNQLRVELKAHKTHSLSGRYRTQVAYIENPHSKGNYAFFLYMKNKDNEYWPIRAGYCELVQGADRAFVEKDLTEKLKQYYQNTPIYCTCEIISVLGSSFKEGTTGYPFLEYAQSAESKYLTAKLIPEYVFPKTTDQVNYRLAWALSKDKRKYIFMNVLPEHNGKSYEYGMVDTWPVSFIQIDRKNPETDRTLWPSLADLELAHSQLCAATPNRVGEYVYCTYR